jgi:hypothetical protein
MTLLPWLELQDASSPFQNHLAGHLIHAEMAVFTPSALYPNTWHPQLQTAFLGFRTLTCSMSAWDYWFLASWKTQKHPELHHASLSYANDLEKIRIKDLFPKMPWECTWLAGSSQISGFPASISASCCISCHLFDGGGCYIWATFKNLVFDAQFILDYPGPLTIQHPQTKVSSRKVSLYSWG